MCQCGMMYIINHHNRMFDFERWKKTIYFARKANRFVDDKFEIVAITIDDNEWVWMSIRTALNTASSFSKEKIAFDFFFVGVLCVCGFYTNFFGSHLQNPSKTIDNDVLVHVFRLLFKSLETQTILEEKKKKFVTMRVLYTTHTRSEHAWF